MADKLYETILDPTFEFDGNGRLNGSLIPAMGVGQGAFEEPRAKPIGRL